MNPVQGAWGGQSGINPSQGFNSYAAGDKRYGFSGRRGPNTGMALDKRGYAERDRRAEIRRNLLLRRLQAGQAGKPMSADFTRPIKGFRNNG